MTHCRTGTRRWRYRIKSRVVENGPSEVNAVKQRDRVETGED